MKPVDSWLHIPSAENVADILTKGATPSQLGEGSVWQAGPKWLVEDRSLWPVTEVPINKDMLEEIESFKTSDKMLKSMSFSATTNAVDILSKPGQNKSTKEELRRFDLLELFGANDGRFSKLVARFSDLSKLIRVMAYCLRLLLAARSLGGTSLAGRGKEISAMEYNDAWLVLIFLEQSLRLKEADVRKLVPRKVKIKLSTYNWTVEHVLLGGRVSNFPVGYSSENNIPIIPYGPLGRLIMLHYHDKIHRDVDTVVTVARADVWIIKARKLASEWDNRCKICLEKRQKVSKQKMGDLPSCRTEIKPAWTSVCMDLFGPYQIRDDCVKKGPRIYKKVWGVIFTCTLTRGVYLDVALGYDTESVLHPIRRLLAAKGNVRLIISDPGTQLKGANNELVSWRKGWDSDALVRFGAEKGVDWSFVMPDGQHQNGACEILIKLVKGIRKAFLKSLGEQILSLNELNTLNVEISNLVNERPVGVKPNTYVHPEYLSPNSLYLGRCSDRISSGPFSAADAFSDTQRDVGSRFRLVQSITDQYWKNWIKIHFPTLLVEQKWHTSRRNLRVNDIVLLQEDSAFRAEWRLARVTEVYPDRRGNVRNVQVLVKPKQDSTANYKPSKGYELNRHVSRLIVLVPVEEQDVQEDTTEDSSDNAASNEEVLSRTLGSELGGTVNAGCHWSDLGQ